VGEPRGQHRQPIPPRGGHVLRLGPDRRRQRPTRAKYAEDPYDTGGLDETSFLYQYGHTQQPGTSETSRFSYDFINNPNTINQIFYVGARADFSETTPTGVKIITKHILKDGADSSAWPGPLLRVPINIGSEGDYWADHLWNPITGTSQSPFSIRRSASRCPRPDGSSCCVSIPGWARRGRIPAAHPFLASYLASYTPFYLAEIKGDDGQPKYITKDKDQLKRGATVFADNCARCHSNKQPAYPLHTEEDRRRSTAGSCSPTSSSRATPSRRLSATRSTSPGWTSTPRGPWPPTRSKATSGPTSPPQDYKALPSLGYQKFFNPLNQLDRERYGPAPIGHRVRRPRRRPRLLPHRGAEQPLDLGPVPAQQLRRPPPAR
jgi:hypothetical protein